MVTLEGTHLFAQTTQQAAETEYLPRWVGPAIVLGCGLVWYVVQHLRAWWAGRHAAEDLPEDEDEELAALAAQEKAPEPIEPPVPAEPAGHPWYIRDIHHAPRHGDPVALAIRDCKADGFSRTVRIEADGRVRTSVGFAAEHGAAVWIDDQRSWEDRLAHAGQAPEAVGPRKYTATPVPDESGQKPGYYRLPVLETDVLTGPVIADPHRISDAEGEANVARLRATAIERATNSVICRLLTPTRLQEILDQGGHAALREWLDEIVATVAGGSHKLSHRAVINTAILSGLGAPMSPPDQTLPPGDEEEPPAALVCPE